MPNVSRKWKKAKAIMLGLGLDSDGHKRVTTGPNFALVGGSKQTHDEMTEKAVKINEKLKAKGKELHEISREEFDEIALSIGLNRHRLQSKGDAWVQFKAEYYLYGILFLIFDVETIFLLPFAVAFAGLSAGAFVAMMIFLLLLVEGLIWAWQKGVLRWA